MLRTLSNVSFHLDHSTVQSCLRLLLRVSSLYLIFFSFDFFSHLIFFLYWIIHYQSSILPVVRQVQPLAVATPSTSRAEKDDESKIRKDMKAIQASSKREVQELRAKVGMFFFFHFFKISLFHSFSFWRWRRGRRSRIKQCLRCKPG